MECECCNEFFERGTGHLCMCPHCEKKHKICNECYLQGKAEGNIVDKDFDLEDIMPEMKRKWK